MRKLISFMHISLDGFVAGPNGEMNWIKIDEEIFDHVANRINKGDTAMYGSVTYKMMEDYWPTAGTKPNASKHDIEHAKWYSKIRKIVLSKTMQVSENPTAHIINNNFLESINQIKNETGEDILVFGSPSSTHFLIEQNLIDGYWLFVNPIILGKGIPLFKNIHQETFLTLRSSTTFSNGVIELDYLVKPHS